jgi:hypothetical protein
MTETPFDDTPGRYGTGEMPADIEHETTGATEDIGAADERQARTDVEGGVE